MIRERDLERRFIPVRLDNANILGLSSNVFYVDYREGDLQQIVDACVKRLLLFERDIEVERPTEYERILSAIQTESKGALAKAYQLVKDKRERSPFENAEYPAGEFSPVYEIAETEWRNYSTIRRRSVKIWLPEGLSKDEVIFNLKHCCVEEFNSAKPDAVWVGAYHADKKAEGVSRPVDVGRIEFAPFGDWGRAEEGFAYNIPTSEFKFNVSLNESYFGSS